MRWVQLADALAWLAVPTVAQTCVHFIPERCDSCNATFSCDAAKLPDECHGHRDTELKRDGVSLQRSHCFANDVILSANWGKARSRNYETKPVSALCSMGVGSTRRPEEETGVAVLDFQPLRLDAQSEFSPSRSLCQ